MREILFRGKRLDTGEWVKGFYCNLGGKYHYILTGMLDIMKGYPDLVKHPVDPDTVGQYIGLMDKSGNRIFEGDRVVYPDSTSYGGYDDYNEGVVDYDVEAMRFYFTDRWFVEMEDFDVVDGMMVDVEIIGNIHDNPELLEDANGQN